MYSQGDIIAIDFPFTDGEGRKVRPALIISNNLISSTGDVIVVAITSRNSLPDFLLEIDNALLSQPLPKQSFIRFHRLHTLHTSLIQHKVSVASPKLLDMVRDKIMSVIS